jgi:hypothetical protein
VHAFKHIYAHGKGFIFTPKATNACTKTDSGAMEMLIAHCCTNDPKCMHQSKMRIFGKARNHMNFGLVFLAHVPLLSFSFVALKKKNFGQVNLQSSI